MLLRNKLDLDKPPIIQKYSCHKLRNQNFSFFLFLCYIMLNNQMRVFHLNFVIFKTLISGTKVKGLDKISLT
jgi:hypothetical protein